MVERRAQCPYCGERIWLMLDLSAGRQAYTEDCQVCCQPMLVIFDVEDGEAVELRVERGS
ncbi:MAG: CPXCG motif-containing cysteine-rich protein [Gammaproteobacteria bacterium]|nr:CPXCG motif-containing cysteine-rich protein [Gammaproteobacteria bacterium]MDH4254398.1 CPXCG motif-containing cysteine-rich protein [Gammaproteobacteria bacterium]MDH5309331.1 CPXCG motif-containing cysteine-rich protein [Gammaproteobacteria bacterium]